MDSSKVGEEIPAMDRLQRTVRALFLPTDRHLVGMKISGVSPGGTQMFHHPVYRFRAAFVRL